MKSQFGSNQLKYEKEANMNFIKKLFCKHNYKYLTQHKIDSGMRKVIYYQCDKCRKVKVEVI